MLRDEGSTQETVDQHGVAPTLPPFDDPKYRAALECDDLTDEQATELLRAVDSIMRMFVDLGFGVDAVQLALPELFSKQSESLADFSVPGESGAVQIEDHTTDFNDAAQERGSARKAEDEKER